MSTDRKNDYRVNPADLPGESVIFGCTPVMDQIRQKIDSVLSSELPVLIQGESGTGKEVIARFLHARSPRHDAPFLKLNCAAIPAHLMENELFGYEKASPTGAREVRVGLVEIADRGTLFLDEIGEMHLDLQGKLVHLLQHGTYTRRGGDEALGTGVRIICATNSDLKKAVEAGTFLSHLYDLIAVMEVRLPALRDRKGDIPQLCEYFLQKLAQQFRRPAPQLNPVTLNLLKEWNWPGNMRELENWTARAIILGDDLALGAELKRQVKMNSYSDSNLGRVNTQREVSRQETSTLTNTMILQVLEANRWNRRKTAEDLHISYRSLIYKLRQVGMPQRRRSHRSGFPSAG